ncbi:glycosyltransferase [Lysobacter sp. H21R4]|uniref:glycosyltransferase n=1 Tax=Lysobacter sp. H21R4 TaxID=2781021 RepID=UPI001886DC4A|nr:glycosyltransferase [Lysobacter sp. H21R4]QOY61977.1 glycosyltransferase [Lysobacter sp. H21R4]
MPTAPAAAKVATRVPPPLVAARSADAPAPLRLLLLTDTSILAPGGSERFLRNLAARLPGDRYRITIVQLSQTVRAWSDVALPGAIENVSIRSLPIAACYGYSGLRALHCLAQLLQRERFDIVQSQHEKSDLFNALLPHRAGAIHVSNRRDMGFNKTARLRWVSRFLNHRFNRVVAPSQQILAALRDSEDIAPGRMVWIPNGVDTERFRPAADSDRAAVRASLGLGPETVAFGCLARLTEVKCHADLVQAFAVLRESVPDVRLVLLGGGPLQRDIAAQVAELGLDGCVSFLGDRPDVEQLLPALDVSVLASSTEGMSNAILESMACGLPMIATSVGGNIQLVQDQASGLLVPPRDPAALAAAMLVLARSAATRLQMGACARRRVEREFSLDAMVHAYDRMYANLAGRT